MPCRQLSLVMFYIRITCPVSEEVKSFGSHVRDTRIILHLER